MPSPERQSARMSKITNDGLIWSDTGCFIAAPIWQQWALRVKKYVNNARNVSHAVGQQVTKRINTLDMRQLRTKLRCCCNKNDSNEKLLWLHYTGDQIWQQYYRHVTVRGLQRQRQTTTCNKKA